MARFLTASFLLLLSHHKLLQAAVMDVRVSLDPLYGDRNLLYVRHNDTVTLHCSIIGQLQPEGFEWLHNGVLVSNRRYDVTSVRGQLSIRRVSHREEGSYNCRVDIGLGILLSETVILKLAGAVNDHKVVGGQRSDRKGISVLPCDVSGYSVPPGQVTWLREDQIVKPTENIHIDLNGALLFLYKTTDDLNEYYQCQAHNTVLNVTLSGNKTALTDRFHRPQSEPDLLSSSLLVTGTEGDDVTMECVFKGDPSPSITWTDTSNRPITANMKYKFPSIKGRQLLITHLTLADSGRYTCTAQNPLGSESSKLKVIVIERPRVLVPPVSVTVLAGCNVTYSCATKTEANTTLIWFIDGKHFDKDDDKHFLANRGATLIMTSAYPQTNSSCVQCNISTDRFYTLYSACVQYVDSEEKLPKTTTSFLATASPGPQNGSPTSPTPRTTILVPVVCGVVGVVVVIAVVVTVIVVRQRHGRQKKRLSTIGTELPDRASLLMEAHMLAKSNQERNLQCEVEQ